MPNLNKKIYNIDYRSEGYKEIYNIDHWSEGYFDVDPSGNIIVQPDPNNSKITISIIEIIKQAQKKFNTKLPLLIRVHDILKQRVKLLQQAFKTAFTTYEYNNQYLPVYPIKVNQQHSVINSLINNNFSSVGLESGSKTELLAVIKLALQYNNTIIVNGYKDADYIQLALLGQKLGLNIYIIIEKLTEIPLIISYAKKLNLTPKLGIRARLNSLGKGKWQNTGGIKSKFGLTAAQILTAINLLRQNNLLSQLNILHFHLGSQVADISDIQQGILEGSRLYIELIKLGANLNTIDIGGGLGIDYEGTKSRNYCSINYNINEYANTVVRIIAEHCNNSNIKHPKIITESGRAMAAHHAILVTNILSVEPINNKNIKIQPSDNLPLVIYNLYNNLHSLSKRNVIETYHKILFYYKNLQEQFLNNLITLEQLAIAENIYIYLLQKIQQLLDPKIKSHRVIFDKLSEDLANKVFCNFSLFQSLPDIWAFKQIFPIMPISQLNNKLSQRGLIQDMTCDSDGRIDNYISGQSIENALPLPKYDPKDPYYLGFFLVGAYQEILGDLHNLFGKPNCIDLHYNNKFILEFSKGHSSENLLSQVNFDIKSMKNIFAEKIATAKLSTQEKNIISNLISLYFDSDSYLCAN